MPTKRKKPTKRKPSKVPEVRMRTYPEPRPFSDINKVPDLSEDDIAESHRRERERDD